MGIIKLMKFSILIILSFSVNLPIAMANEKYLSVPEEVLRGAVRTNLDSPNPTKEQLARKEKFSTLVAKLGVPVNKGLPVVEDAKKVNLRSTEQISKRAIAVAIAAVKAEGMPQNEVEKIVKKWGVESYFSPEESSFINNPNPSQSDKQSLLGDMKDLMCFYGHLDTRKNFLSRTKFATLRKI